MDSLIFKSTFLPPPLPNHRTKPHKSSKPPNKTRRIIIFSSVYRDPWSLSDGDPARPKPKSKNPKHRLSDDDARRIIKKKAQYLSVLRRNQGPQAQTPKWIKRTPEQMVQYLQDDRNGHLYGKHVVAAIKTVRALSERRGEEYDMRMVMSSFVGKLTFREMCVVLKEQKGWRQVKDFFAWMKLQFSYRPSVIAYTIVLRVYGQVGKIKLAEHTFLEMLEAGCEPDEVACGTMLCSYARWGQHKAMLSFHSAVQERGVMLSVAVYNFILSSLQKKSLHGKVIEIWKQMVVNGVAPNNFTFTVIVSSLVKEHHYEEALRTFNEMKNLGLVPEEVIYSLLISLSTKTGNWDQALKLYEDMRSLAIVPSNFTCASLLTMYYKIGDYSKALSLFSEMGRNKIAADEVIYGLLIRIYGKLGLYEDAEKMFEETQQLGILSDEKTYLAMAQVHLNSRNVEKALDVIALMKSRTIWLSRFGCIVLLQCYVMKEDLESAEAAFQALSKTGFPDTGSCNDMLNLYARLEMTEKAKDLIAHIRKNQVGFDLQLLKTVMEIYCEQGMLKDAEQLIGEMATNRSFKGNNFILTLHEVVGGQNSQHSDSEENPEASSELDTTALAVMLRLHLADGKTTKTGDILKLLLETSGGLSVVTQLVSRFTREGDISRGKTLYDLTVKLGYKLNDGAVASLISSYGKLQKVELAQEVFAAYVDSPACGKLVFNSMIDAYAKVGRLEEAYLLYKEVIKKGHDLGAVAISIIVNALTNCGKHQEAQNIIRGTLQDGMELDTIAYNTFIKAMLVAGKLHFATSIYKCLLSSGCTPSIQTYNTMISVYGRGRKLDDAIEMFNSARNLGVSLDEKAYTNMINFLGKAGKIHEASRLFSEMQEVGIKPGMVSCNIMSNVYAMVGLHGEIENLFVAMQRDGPSPDSFTFLSLIRAYAASSKYSEAEETIKVMQKKGIRPSCGHFNHLLSAFAKSGMMGEAGRVYKEMLTSGFSPDVACNRTMLRGYMDYGHVEEGIRFFEQIQKSLQQDKFVMSAAVYLYKFAGRELEAEAVLNSLNSSGVRFLNDLQVGSKIKLG
ncbi:pentatricopeptide repeat-containing protein [Tripterygium wilfordii]|uniref:Pentatricopeptide repeat-containing protein n=1 Tax=Tripterygium wilfordii TaxID=458696 RepID=A0A7J7C9H9_TRIWF|nr:pentatricopeptide repeat-containing protein At5g27270 isoform X2 [Tripterygium wilfordii]KAF5730779.1 pentatricopeptide repeat-containing protein [Tripterygium wilfordii]